MWWANEAAHVLRQLDDTLVPLPFEHPRPLLIGFPGSLADFLDVRVKEAYAGGRSVRQMCDPHGAGWGSGPFLFETFPSVVFVLMKHGHDFEEAVTVAVRDTRDNDTIAAIVGAVLGALHGKQAIPARWLKGLSGRTRERDDGQVFRLIEQARRRFWDGESD
jgi:hypothetical protein